MRDLVHLIEQKARQYREHRLFAYLRDSTLAPEVRLAFAPSAAHYILTFTDFCEHVLRQEPTDDPIQKIVNAQTYEEAAHSKWFLDDLGTLGFDPLLRFSDALRFVWSGETARSRVLSYQLCRLALEADSTCRLVLVHCVEATAEVMVGHVMNVGKEWTARTGKPLHFFGQTHESAEEQHAFKADEMKQTLEAIRLDPESKERLVRTIHRTFEQFGYFTDELMEANESGRRPVPAKPTDS